MEWFKVQDKLPSDHERVLALLNGEIIVLELRIETPTFEETFKPFPYWHEPYDEYMDIKWDEVTHWMPLPNVPDDMCEST